MNETLLDQASDFAFKKLREVGGDPAYLPLPLRTVVIIYSAQGIIDNGGLEYFYESDFDYSPPYSTFVDAYRRIGSETAASCIEKTCLMFEISDPHLHQSERRDFLERVKKDEEHEFSSLSRSICGDQSVWECLSDYVNRNRLLFQAA